MTKKNQFLYKRNFYNPTGYKIVPNNLAHLKITDNKVDWLCIWYPKTYNDNQTKNGVISLCPKTRKRTQSLTRVVYEEHTFVPPNHNLSHVLSVDRSRQIHTQPTPQRKLGKKDFF